MKDDIVWNTIVDKIYDCRVIRNSNSQGILSVKNTKTYENVLTEKVDLSRGAYFGAEENDVNYWKYLCISAIDKTK